MDEPCRYPVRQGGQFDADVAFAGYTGSNVYTEIWENTGSGFGVAPYDFVDLSNGSLTWADADRDGDLDLHESGNTLLVVSYTRLYDRECGDLNTAPSAPTVLQGRRE